MTHIATILSRRTAGGRVWSRRWTLLLAVGWALQAGVRIWLSRGQSVPLANPDESAYLTAARVLAGGPASDFSYGTLYPAGYPLLITPVFWFTHDPAGAYHAVMVVNALVSALVMPLGYLACRRLGIGQVAAYAVGMVMALLPSAVFYSQFALVDAIFPVVVLGWLLATHAWLTARSARAQWRAAFGSALLAGYAYMCHARGLIILACYAVLCLYVFARRLVMRETAVAAGLTVLVTSVTGWAANRHIAALMYSQGARSLSSEIGSRVRTVHGVLLIIEMAGGQLWRLVLDGWGISAIGLAAASATVLRKGLVDRDLRIIALLTLIITLLIAVLVPAALPANEPQDWASPRYLDCMIVAYFPVGLAVLLRASRRSVLASAAAVVPLALLTAVFVTAYAGTSLPIPSWGKAFNFAVPAVLTGDWRHPNVALVTVIMLAMLAVWALACSARSPQVSGVARPAMLAGVAVLSLTVTTLITNDVSRHGTAVARAQATALITGGWLKPGEPIAFGTTLPWQVRIPQAYQIWWTQPVIFNPASQPIPAGVTVVEVGWPAPGPGAPAVSFTASGGSASGATVTVESPSTESASAARGMAAGDADDAQLAAAKASWPQAPAGWQVVALDPIAGWVAWTGPAP